MSLLKPTFKKFEMGELESFEPPPVIPISAYSAKEDFSIVCEVPLKKNKIFKEPFRTSFISVYFITKGAITFTLDKVEYTAGANSLDICSPNSLKQFVDSKPATEFCRVCFSASFLAKASNGSKLFKNLELFSSQYDPIIKLSAAEASLILDIFKQLTSRFLSINEHPSGHEIFHHTFCIFFYELSALSNKNKVSLKTQLSIKEDLVMRFINLAEENFRVQHKVCFFSDQLCVTSKYLSEVVSEITGTPPHCLINNYLIVEAKLLLDNPTLTVSQIADMLNFPDQSSFGKFFKRNTGTSPYEYRNQQ